MKITKLSASKNLLALCICASLISSAQADDIEMALDQRQEKPNLLFLLDVSRSMDFPLVSGATAAAAPGVDSRMKILKSSFTTLLNDPTLQDVNIGISLFGRFRGGAAFTGTSASGVIFPVSPIDGRAYDALDASQHYTGNWTETHVPKPTRTETTRQYLVSSKFLDTIVPTGATPLVDGLYESYLYFRGLNVDFGFVPPWIEIAAHPATYTGPYPKAEFTSPQDGTYPMLGIGEVNQPITYISPVKECTNNAVVMISDGTPSVNFSADKVRDLIGGTENCNDDIADASRCGAELATYVGTHSMTGDEADKEYLKIYTIGISLSSTAAEYITKIADNSGGEVFLAGNETDLVNAFSKILKTESQAHTFTSPAFTPDPSSMLTHDNYTYLAMFGKQAGGVWDGNLKKFKVVNNQLVDKTGALAFNPNGALKLEAEDFWSTESGTVTHPVKTGGTAQLLTNPLARHLYTDVAGNNLTSSANYIATNNLLISKTLLGDAAMSTLKRDELLSYIRGEKVMDGAVLPRKHMGDILHSKPVVINYGQDGKVIYIGTNEGYLHAFDDDSGAELFAYMPSELLANIKPQYDKELDNHIYGVDGPITVRHDDSNKNGVIDTGEKAVLYFGLRRGGQAYYAVDISTRTQPKLLWKLTNTDTSTSHHHHHSHGSNDFENLGFTWSKPTLATMSYTKNGSTKSNQPVLIFGGGYIDDHANESELNTKASDVYVVDADTGALIWKTPTDTISYAVPGKINVLDINADGSIDRLYFADVGGHIWRVDFTSNNFDNTADQTVHEFADLSSTENRKFFTEPDIAMFNRGGKYFISLAIGSGERPNPLKEDSDNYFFVLFDKNINLTNTSPSTIHLTDLINVTTSATTTNILSSTTKTGWYMDLEAMTGEKVFSKSLTYKNKVMFNTVGVGSSDPSPSASTSCDIAANNPSVFYALDLFTSGPVLKIGPNQTLARSTEPYGTGNIPGTPQIYYSGFKSSTDGDCTSSDCTRTEGISVQNRIIPIENTDALKKVFWFNTH